MYLSTPPTPPRYQNTHISDLPDEPDPYHYFKADNHYQKKTYTTLEALYLSRYIEIIYSPHYL